MKIKLLISLKCVVCLTAVKAQPQTIIVKPAKPYSLIPVKKGKHEPV
jgi:hypothetical protein